MSGCGDGLWVGGARLGARPLSESDQECRWLILVVNLVCLEALEGGAELSW